MALSRVLSPTMVGRDAELSTLEDWLLSALRGDGGVVIVGGEAGMGKTRLVAALASRARRLGCAVVSGGCSEAELSLPYLPFLEAIGNYLATADLPSLRDRLGSATHELAQLFPQMGDAYPSAVDSTQAKLRLFESILLLLRDAAKSRALLVILEDLQWADPATRELLDYSTRRLRATNVLIVATYRTDEMHRKHALLPTIQAWRRANQVEMLELKALDGRAVGEMVCAIFEEKSVTDEFRDFLLERSEGNPFVLEEMLRESLDRGDVYKGDTGWDRKTLAEIRLPATVRDTILNRLERLAPENRLVLSAASVLGRSFDLATLTAVAQSDADTVLAALETSVMAQLIEEDDRSSGRYRFRHALTREAIYEDLVVPRRQQFHGRVADVLKSTDSAPVEIANHLLLASRFDEAVAMCEAAARGAKEAFAFRDAAHLLERVTPYVRDAVARGRLLCKAGELYWQNNEPAAARGLLEEGIGNLDAAGLVVEAAGQRLVLGRCYWELIRSDSALDEFKKARDVLETEGPSEALAVAYLRLSGMLAFNRVSGQSLEYAQRAVDTAQQAGADLALSWALNFLALSEIGLGRLEAGFGHLEDSYRKALAGDYYLQAVNAIFNASWIAVQVGRGDLVKLWSERAAAPQWAGSVWTPFFRSLTDLYQGRVAEAIEIARLSLQRSRDFGLEKQRWRSLLMVAHALTENLQAEEAARLLPPLSSRVEGQDTVYDTTPNVRTRLALGDAEGALEMARTVSPDVCDDVSPVDVVAEAARADPQWLREFMARIGVQGESTASPRLAAARGRLALYEDRLDDALDELRAAVAAFDEGGMRLDAWHVGRALAEAEHRSGDLESARRRFDQIIADSEAAGALLASKLARDLGVGLGIELAQPSPPRSPSAPRIATGERLVSVMFADVRGFTRMTAENAPAEIAERISTLQRWAGREVERRHGIVDKFAGDAVMATFNVTGESVDHAVEALRSAIAIIDKAALAGLPVGAGIAVGPAVVGNLTESANMSVLGEVTNLASRLQAEAAAGEVLVAADAYRRVASWLAEQRIEGSAVELKVKGIAAPITAYRLVVGVAPGLPA